MSHNLSKARAPTRQPLRLPRRHRWNQRLSFLNSATRGAASFPSGESAHGYRGSRCLIRGHSQRPSRKNMEKVTGPGVPAVQRKAFNIRPYMFQCCAAILATGSIVTYMNVHGLGTSRVSGGSPPGERRPRRATAPLAFPPRQIRGGPMPDGQRDPEQLLTEARQGFTNASNNYQAIFSGNSGEQNFLYQFENNRPGYLAPGPYIVSLMQARKDPRLTRLRPKGNKLSAVHRRQRQRMNCVRRLRH